MTATQASDEIPELQDDVLASARTLLAPLRSAHIVGSEQDDRKTNVRMRLELLDNRSTAVRVLVQEDGL